MTISGLDEEPREVALGTSVMLGNYLLTLRLHQARPDRIQVLLTRGRELVNESWINRDELQAIVNPILTRRVP